MAGYGLFKDCGGGKLPFIWESSQDTWSSAPLRMVRQLRAYGSQMREQNNMGDITVGVGYSSPEQDKAQEALFLYSSRSLTLQASVPHTEHELPSYFLEGKQQRE